MFLKPLIQTPTMLLSGPSTRTSILAPVSMMAFGKGTREKRMGEIYCAIPKSMKTQQADPFNYKLRSLPEVQEQMKYFPPNIIFDVEYKRYTAGDYRQNDENNTDDRERVSKIRFDIRDLNLAPLQRERFIFLLGSRYNHEKNPFKVKIVTK